MNGLGSPCQDCHSTGISELNTEVLLGHQFMLLQISEQINLASKSFLSFSASPTSVFV